MMEFLFKNLPQGWSRSDLDSIISFAIGGDWGKDPEHEASEYIKVLCVRGAEFRHWSSDKGKTASFRKVKASSLDARVTQCGDILLEISGGGPEQPVGRTVLIDKEAMAHHENVSKICTNFLRLLRPSRLISAAYLNEFLGFFYRSGKVVEYQAGSNNLRNLKFKDYMGIGIPIPPLAEQERIIFKLEELFSELDKGVDNLRTAQQQLKVYRQALLKHAFEGKLTAEWRAQNPDKLESAEALLARIQQEREARYQQQLAEWQADQQAWAANDKIGNKPAKPKMPKTLSPLTAEELAELPELPTGWRWIRPEEIAAPESYSIGIGPFGSNLKVEDYRESGIPLIFVRNITRSDFTRDLKYIDHSKYLELEAHSVKPLDLVITKMGDPPGDCEIYPAESPMAVLTADCLKFRLWADFADHQLYKSCINSNLVRKQLGLITKGVAQKKISVDRFKTIYLPLMCVNEQKQISRELDEKFSVIDQLETTIATALQQAEALRQSILKKAFSGQLVPQHPDDEPASVLLERIRAERATQPQARGRKPKASA